MAASGGGGPPIPVGPGGQPGGGFSGAGIGRISGPLLKDNLLRNGVDLAFETDLLYLNVNDIRIGVKTDSVSRELEVVGDAKTIDLIVDDLITATNVLIDDANNITTSTGSLYLNAVSSIHAPAITTDNLKINNNRINSVNTNSHLEFYPTKDTIFNSNVWIEGNLHATGTVTFDGDIVFGDSDTDNVSFSADVNSSILPNVEVPSIISDFSLGNVDKQWNTLYAKALRGATIVASTLSTPANINFSLRFNNAIFVSTTGSNSNQGDHQNSPYRNLAYAVTQATAGDTIFVYPGTYTEIFPITVPAGVSIAGFGIRSTIIQPTALTRFKDAFLLNGETTVSDLTLRDFFYNLTDNTGHAFRFANNLLVTTRSPYIQNVSVITHGSSIDGIDGGPASQIIDAILDGGSSTGSFSDIINAGESLDLSTVEDPLGFADGDAGKGALIDGSVADSDSIEATMLFHSCTFITPGVDTITMTNGVRVEWLNSFTYFANRGLYATRGTLGFASLEVKFGAEIRSIGSANVYGNYGAVADGVGTLMYLINHNFAYIGSGKDSSNDSTLAIRTNEAVELNSGKVYYQSHNKGMWRVGDAFYVNLEEGVVSFDNVDLAANGLSTLLLIGTGTRTFVTADYIETGNFRLSGNTIETLSNAFNIQSASELITWTQNVSLSKNLLISGDFQNEGTLTFGNQTQDVLSFSAKISHDLNPSANNSYDLGSNIKKWKRSYSNTLSTTGIKFTDSEITTYSGGNLSLVGNGTGGVQIETLFFNNSTISALTTNNNIIITPNSDYNVVIDKNSAVKLPSTATTLTATGGMRLNSSTGIFGGFDGVSEVGLGGIYSQNRATSVSVHPTNNTASFTVNSTVTTTISPTQLTTHALSVSGLVINNNTFTTSTNGNLTIVSDSLQVDDVVINGSDISAPIDQNIVLKSTGQGYVSFQNSGGAIALPYGTNAERPTSPELGNARFNTEEGYYEIWDGTQWSSVSGSGEVATFEYLNEQTTLWSIVLG